MKPRARRWIVRPSQTEPGRWAAVDLTTDHETVFDGRGEARAYQWARIMDDLTANRYGGKVA